MKTMTINELKKKMTLRRINGGSFSITSSIPLDKITVIGDDCKALTNAQVKSEIDRIAGHMLVAYYASQVRMSIN